MRIIADKNIPYVREAFSEFGEVILMPGREIIHSNVRNADILLVRTVTQVDENLLRNSTVQFVGTATIGYDHVDIDYLNRRNIAFSYAAGCNANSVAEYIVGALFVLARRFNLILGDLTLGIVGVGNVGGRVVEKAQAIGMDVLLNDPPKARMTGDRIYQPLERILEESDIVTLHVPLTMDGIDATYHLGNRDLFEKMNEGSFIINTSRGAVVDSDSLIHALYYGKIKSAVIDVWEGEPSISTQLLECIDIGTPHIAGYSRDGKANATLLLYQAACKHFNRPDRWKPLDLPKPENQVIDVTVSGRTPQDSIGHVIKNAYDIERDDRALRTMVSIPAHERDAFFDRLRNEYPVRREFHSMAVRPDTRDTEILPTLLTLGFQLTNEYELHEIKEYKKL
jgi:erythronate-4-phosphate dehydrogenase